MGGPSSSSGLPLSLPTPDEAEYAWLPLDCLHPFQRNKAPPALLNALMMTVMDDNGELMLVPPPEDPNLRPSVEQAEAALVAMGRGDMGTDDEEDEEADSDSDGGA